MSYMPATLLLMNNQLITTPQNAIIYPSSPVDGLARAKSIFIYNNFVYGANGTTSKAIIQTSVDGGVSWIDVANFNNTTASRTVGYNLISTTAITNIYTTTSGTLANDTSVSGIIGDQFRVLFTSTGTYTGNTTLTIAAVLKD